MKARIGGGCPVWWKRLSLGESEGVSGTNLRVVVGLRHIGGVGGEVVVEMRGEAWSEEECQGSKIDFLDFGFAVWGILGGLAFYPFSLTVTPFWTIRVSTTSHFGRYYTSNINIRNLQTVPSVDALT